jgi:hypothetical protein
MLYPSYFTPVSSCFFTYIFVIFSETTKLFERTVIFHVWFNAKFFVINQNMFIVWSWTRLLPPHATGNIGHISKKSSSLKLLNKLKGNMLKKNLHGNAKLIFVLVLVINSRSRWLSLHDIVLVYIYHNYCLWHIIFQT